MKVKISLLHLLIFGSLTVFGLSERISNKLAKKAAVCELRCETDTEPAKCEEKCNSLSDECAIPVLDIEAGLNVEHVCQFEDVQTIHMDSIGVFALEYHNESSDWILKTLQNFSRKGYLSQKLELPGGRYQWRFTRVSAEGISRPATTEWFTWREPGVKPTHVPDIWVQCLTLGRVPFSFADSITAEMGFTRAKEDISCYFNLICSQDQGDYSQSWRYVRDGKVKIFFAGLPFGGRFTIRIISEEPRFDGDETVVKFSTPSKWPDAVGPEICVPSELEDLNASVIYHEEDQVHHVNVSWRKPAGYNTLDFVTVGIAAIEGLWTFKNVSGKLTRTTFKNVTIWQQYNVSVRGWSYLGPGPETSKLFTIPYKLIDPPAGLGTTAIIGLISGVSLIVATGICVYLICKRLKRRQKLVKSSKLHKDEIDPDRLVITRVLGSGTFGVVKFGRLRDDEGQTTNVAVKMLRDDTNDTELRNFRLEIDMMKSLDKHPNIISFLGYRTTGLYPFLVVEYCPRGDLLSFLRAASFKTTKSANDEKDKLCLTRPGPSNEDTIPQENSEGLSITTNEDVDGYIDTVDAEEGATVTFLDMLNFGRQIATGMEYLSSKRIVHRDLATRNILVCAKGVVKISDFGLSRDIYQENMYKKTGNGRMPFKWMAIESLMHQVYTTQSDVWSFGILLWEIMTLGVTPYPGVPTIEILKRLQMGYRMDRPDICSEALYNVMLSCWNANPKNRPTFTVLRKQLDRFIRVAAEHEYLDADYVSFGLALDEDLEPSSSRDTSCQLQASFVNYLEPRIVLEGLEQSRKDAEDCAEDCSK